MSVQRYRWSKLFWIDLWEKEGQGNANAKWLQEIWSAFARNVPSSSEGDGMLDTKTVEKALVKRKAWSAPGPDKIVNCWWKKLTVMHKDMAKAFQAIIEGSQDLPLWFSELQRGEPSWYQSLVTLPAKTEDQLRVWTPCTSGLHFACWPWMTHTWTDMA